MMRIELHHSSRDFWYTLEIADGRKSLGDLIALLDVSAIDAMTICGYNEERLPKALFSMEELKTLKFDHCLEMKCLPAGLTRLPNLVDLAFQDCPDFYDLTGISELESLRALRICSCYCFDALHPEFKDCKHLELLDISHSEAMRGLDINALPASLRILDVRGCRRLSLTEMDDSLWPKIVSLSDTDWSIDGPLPTQKLEGISARVQHQASRKKHLGAARDGVAGGGGDGGGGDD